MNTYNISFNGITILKNIPEEEVNKQKETVRNYLSVTSDSKTLKDIEGSISVTLNKEDNHCNN